MSSARDPSAFYFVFFPLFLVLKFPRSFNAHNLKYENYADNSSTTRTTSLSASIADDRE